MKKKVVILGGKGTGLVIASIILDAEKSGEKIGLKGFLNDDMEIGSNIEKNLETLGNITNENCKSLLDEDCYFVNALMKPGFANERIKKVKNLEIPPERFITIFHPTAVVSEYATIGHGVILAPNVIVNPGAIIGNMVQVMGGALLGHDCEVKDFSFISNNASIGAYVKVEEGAHIGSNSSIIENVTVNKGSLVGIGTVLLNDVPEYSKVVGNPGRILN